MGFRDREKQRLVPLKLELFSAEASEPETYKGKRRDFCLRNDRARENLYAGIRDDALSYFSERNIHWHDGSKDAPSNHLCCSQTFCVNFWFAFSDAPEPLAAVLRELGYDAVEMLPFEMDRTGREDKARYAGFEWIGARNYLAERVRGRVARDEDRSRGQRFTSLDFAFRFRHSDGLIQIVAGEWKYTENYTNGNDIRFSRSGTDRLDIYRPSLEAPGCQIALNGVSKEALFFDPFDPVDAPAVVVFRHGARRRDGSGRGFSSAHRAGGEPGVRRTCDVARIKGGGCRRARDMVQARRAGPLRQYLCGGCPSIGLPTCSGAGVGRVHAAALWRDWLARISHQRGVHGAENAWYK